MKPYIPQLDVDDTVWIMMDNKPIELPIVIVTISYWKNMAGTECNGVEYTLFGGKKLYECTSSSPGDFIYRTKKDLLASL